ncbi:MULTISPECIES: hypothetical protein [Priestia]|uniref:hypothetical protein n=1 Tax=Priestia TaxID=2800373 RepID=UPI00112B451C|nr:MULTISPECIES: hypothetical protein [Priestia]
MKLNTAIVEAIISNNWLEYCGVETNLLQGSNYSYLSNIKKVNENVKGVKWENICLEERNILTGYLAKNKSELYNNNWNVLVREVKREVLPKVINKIESQVSILGLSSDIVNSVKFDIINIIMVLTYEKYYNSDFYNSMLDIYLSGHIPCGWDGDYPNGKILVY